MADPIDMLDNPPAPEMPPAPVSVTPTDSVTLSREEFDQMRAATKAFTDAAPLLQALQSQQQPTQQPSQPVTPPTADDDFWQSPAEATRRIINQEVSPYAKQMAAQLGGMVINSFKVGKTSDRFYSGVVPHFEAKAANLDKTWLGSMTADNQLRILEEAWLAAKGAFLDESEKKSPPKTPPPNIGGGSGSGGGSGTVAKKSLQDIDPMAYRMAVNRGWTQERMDAIAAEIIAEQENN